MSIDKFSQNLISSGNNIGATAVISMDGRIVHQTSNWSVDGGHVIKVFTNKEPSISIQGVKYSTIDVSEDRIVATNVGGKGHIVGANIGGKAILIGYVASSGDARSAYIEIDKAARQLSKIL